MTDIILTCQTISVNSICDKSSMPYQSTERRQS